MYDILWRQYEKYNIRHNIFIIIKVLAKNCYMR